MAVYLAWKRRNEKALYSHRNEIVEGSPEMCLVLRSAQRIHNKGKGKGTVHPITGHEGPEGE
jgi:hypothetical protein